MKEEKQERRPAFRDGVEMWTNGEVFTAPGGEVVEILYPDKTSKDKTYFVELPGAPGCAHGETLEEAINEAREKRGEKTPLTDEEKAEYRAENFRFSVSLFRRLTRACRVGTSAWLSDRGLDASTKMTLAEFRKAGGGQWADALERSLQ